jgi:hypothetical protein
LVQLYSSIAESAFCKISSLLYATNEKTAWIYHTASNLPKDY